MLPENYFSKSKVNIKTLNITFNKVGYKYLLLTEFFLLRFMAQAWNAQAIHYVKKARFCNLQYRPRKTRLARCLLYLWVKIEGGKISIQAEWPLMIDVHQILTQCSKTQMQNPSNSLHIYFVFSQYLTTFWVLSLHRGWSSFFICYLSSSKKL